MFFICLIADKVKYFPMGDFLFYQSDIFNRITQYELLVLFYNTDHNGLYIVCLTHEAALKDEILSVK